MFNPKKHLSLIRKKLFNPKQRLTLIHKALNPYQVFQSNFSHNSRELASEHFYNFINLQFFPWLAWLAGLQIVWTHFSPWVFVVVNLVLILVYGSYIFIFWVFALETLNNQE